MTGVFAVDRGVFEHPMFAPEPFTEREAWVWLISAAVWKPQKVRVGRKIFSLVRGQAAFSTRFLAVKWRWSPSRVNRFLVRLKSETMIETLTNHEATQITVCNYDKYQFGRDTGETPSETPNETPARHPRDKEEELNNLIKEEGPANAVPPPVPAKRKKQLPEGWQPNDTGQSLAARAGLQPEVLLENFTDYHRARGTVMLDWDAAFRTWIKNQIRFQKERAPNARRTGSLAGIL